jgi:hypothetical protein
MRSLTKTEVHYAEWVLGPWCFTQLMYDMYEGFNQNRRPLWRVGFGSLGLIIQIILECALIRIFHHIWSRLILGLGPKYAQKGNVFHHLLAFFL